MDSQDWDQRYDQADLVWSEGPNRFVEEIARELPAGRALDLACGEGRNAIWLARQGWTVTGVDFSAVAIREGATPGRISRRRRRMAVRRRRHVQTPGRVR